MRITLLAAPLLALSACHGSHVNWSSDDTDRGDNVHIAIAGSDGNNQVALNIPGLNAKLALPGLKLGDHLDLNGITLAPNTKVGGVDIVAHDHAAGAGSDGHVRIAFTNPDAPAALVAYYRSAASAAGYEAIVANAGAVTAHKGGKQFALAVQPQGAGSTGQITLTGND